MCVCVCLCLCERDGESAFMSRLNLCTPEWMRVVHLNLMSLHTLSLGQIQKRMAEEEVKAAIKIQSMTRADRGRGEKGLDRKGKREGAR